MSSIIDSLWVRLGFQTDTKGLEGFAQKTENAKGMMVGFGAAVAGAFYAVVELVKGAAERLGDIQNFSEQMGLSAREVDALGRVARENDSSLEAMESGIRNLTITAGQAAQGVGRGALLFQKYGLSAKDAATGGVKTVDQLLGDIAEKLHSMPSLAQQKALGARLGFDDATVKLLSEGRENFARLREEALKGIPFSDDQYELADQTDKLFKKAAGSVTLLKNRIAVALMPAVNQLLQRFIAWTKQKDNVDKITDALGKVVAVAKWVVDHFDAIKKVLFVIFAYKVGAKFLDLAESIKKGANAAGLMKTGLEGLKTLLTGALATAIALVAEDLYQFYTGGESVTGWMLEKFPYAVEVMEGALTVLSAGITALTFGSGPLGLLVLGIGGIVIAAKNLKESWAPVMQWFEEVWDSLADAVGRFVNSLTGPLRYALKAMGQDTSWLEMDEDHRGTRNREFNARAREREAFAAALAKNPPGDGGPLGRLRRQQAEASGAASAIGAIPFLGPMAGVMPFMPAPGLAGGGNVTTIGSLSLTVQGGKLDDPGAAKRLFDDFQKQLNERGLAGDGRNPVRGQTRNQQSNVAL